MDGIVSGVPYFITNGRAVDVALDVREDDQKSVVGLRLHRGPTQQWVFELTGDHLYFIRNVGTGKYLSTELRVARVVKGDNGSPVFVADNARFAWWIWSDLDDPSCYNFLAPSTLFGIDLKGYSGTGAGTPVELWDTEDPFNASWRIARVN